MAGQYVWQQIFFVEGGSVLLIPVFRMTVILFCLKKNYGYRADDRKGRFAFHRV